MIKKIVTIIFIFLLLTGAGVFAYNEKTNGKIEHILLVNQGLRIWRYL